MTLSNAALGRTIVFIVLTLATGVALALQPVKIGVLKPWGEEIAYKMWTPTAEYLSKKLTSYQFSIVPLSLDQMQQAVESGSIDFLITNSGNYVELEARYGVTRMATLVTTHQGTSTTRFGAVIIARSDRLDIKTIADLKGKSFMAVKKNAFGGFQMAWLEMDFHGVDPFSDLSELRFSGFPQDNIVYAVLNGQVDAGTVRTGTLERLQAQAKIKLTDLRVLPARSAAIRIGADGGESFPFLHSTLLYPEWPIAQRKGTSSKLAQQVGIALLRLPENSPVARAAYSTGWTVPLDYQPIHELMKILKVGPYVDFHEHGVIARSKEYWWALLLLALIIPYAITYVFRLRGKTRSIEKHLQETQSEWIHAMDFLDDPICLLDLGENIIRANKVFYRLIGIPEKSAVGTNIVQYFYSSDEQPSHPIFRGHQNRRDEIITLEVDDPANEFGFPMEITVSVVRDHTARPTGIMVRLRDLTDVRDKEQKLERLASFAALSPVPVIEISPDGVVTFVNPIADTLFPDLEERGLAHPVLSGLADQLEDLKKYDEPLICDIVIDGFVYEQNISFIADIDVIRIYFWDITSMHDLTKEIAHHARHDALTGLINRREFERQLDQAIQTANYDDKQHALCYLDLDQFKLVNDTCGHIAGDELLKQLTDLLKQDVRESDVFARLGGDEFGLLLTSCPLDRARGIVESLHNIISNFRFTWEDKIFSIGASSGLVPINDMSGDLHQLLSAADSACYIAKDQGRNQVCVYTPDNPAFARQANEMSWTPRIQNALEHNRFVLHFQPIVSLSSNDENRCEVLVRMKDDNDILVPPSAFIPAAERYQMMVLIDLWVVKQTLSVMRENQLGDYHCAINLSGQTVGDAQAMQLIISEIGKSNVDPSRLGFEVTETAMIKSLNAANRFIRTLRGMGCRIALDDFGSGLSSFGYLKNLPVDYVKIDGYFVKDIAKDPISAAMVESINQVGHVMNIQTIAEFVEDIETLNMLNLMGVDYAQGYVIARPKPLLEFMSDTAFSHDWIDRTGN